MVKKRISDLLRQEAHNISESDTDAVIEVASEEVSEPEVEVVDDTANNTSAKRSTPTKADLEATVTDLKAELEQARQKEASLQPQIEQLQSELSEQKKLVHQLLLDLEQTETLKTELKQAKQAAMQLAESNNKLMEEVDVLKKENAALKPKGKLAVQPERKFPNFSQQRTDEPSDFAAKSWLL